MFLHEAKLAAALHHPNVVQVFDIGEDGGSLFFTMEYVHGTDARALLDAARAANRPLPLAVALEIAIGVAAGLHAAHQTGIVHRDVSPSNVLLAHDGAVKVTDFGVAKVAERPIETQPGTLKGKVSYMSPEQCTGGALDRRSDIFSIGILLYELTTLAKPFKGTSDFAIMEHIVHRDPEPPSVHRAELPPELDAIVMHALRRDPAQRFASAQAVQRDLLQLVRDRKLDTSPLAVESYVRELFGGQVDAWRDAFVQSSLREVPSTAITVRERAETPSTPVRVRRRGPRAFALVALLAGVAGAVAIGARRSGASEAPSTAANITPPPRPLPPAMPAPAPEVVVQPPIVEPAPPPTPRPAKRAPVRIAPRPSAPAPATVSEPAPPPAAPPPDAAAAPRVREVPWDPDSATFPKSR